MQFRALLILLLTLATTCVGCRRSDTYPNRPIKLICPWGRGGGTDRVSRQLAVHLESELGVPVTVINATGGKGVTGHGRGMNAKADGYTLLMATLELNTMHWSGLTDLDYKNCIPLMSLNEDYAALFVRNDAMWDNLGQLEADIKARAADPSQKKVTASGTATGGAWHLAVAGWLLNSDMAVEDVVWVPSEGAGPSIQQLISGGLDIVCCSLPEARVQLKAGEMRALGVMSPQRAVGFEDVATFKEQGVEWSLGGWRGIVVPLRHS